MRILFPSKVLQHNGAALTRAVAARSLQDAAAVGAGSTVRQRPLAGQLAAAGCSTPPFARPFSHTRPAQAKANKRKGEAAKAGSSGGSAKSTTSDGDADGRPQAKPEEPLDFADVEYGWRKGAERFEEELRRVRTGGRFSAEAIGAVRVRPDKKRPDETFALRELAAVVPRGGRSVGVLVHEAGLVKPVMSAIQSSGEFNQQPQRSPDNELELILRVEPERPEGLAKRAREVCHAWREQVRAERHRRDTAAKRWRKDRLITSDDKTRHDKELQKLQDKRMGLVDTREKEILHQIGEGGK